MTLSLLTCPSAIFVPGFSRFTAEYQHPHTPLLFAQQLSHENAYSAGFFFFFCTEPEKGPKCRHHSDFFLFWASGMPTASSLSTRTSATNSTQLQVKCHGIWGCSSPRGPVRSPCLGILHLNFEGINYCPSKAWLFSLYYCLPTLMSIPIISSEPIFKQGGVTL